MTDAQVQRLANLAAAYIKAHPSTPYDTGNLKFNSLLVRKVAPYEYEIYIDIGIAPYLEYLIERQQTRGGNKNRHYQWWEQMRVEVAQYLQGFISNGYDKDAISAEMRRMNKIIKQQMAETGISAENGGKK